MILACHGSVYPKASGVYNAYNAYNCDRSVNIVLANSGCKCNHMYISYTSIYRTHMESSKPNNI